jgi:hypothetical protein
MTLDALASKIEQPCEDKGPKFKPWECPTWQARDGRVRNGTVWAETYPKAQALRRMLISEIEQLTE